jgi:3-demethoxyubiquinol 3-hydroxylase
MLRVNNSMLCTIISRNLSKTSRPSALIERILRVDHAGELGADRIYAGQMAVLGNTKVGPTIKHMWEQEKVLI